ncbi:MAG: asparaginase [Rubricella sp.]
MTDKPAAAIPLAVATRGPFDESVHFGHAVVVDAGGGIVAQWGDPTATILPRSSCKMLQALPLIESGAAREAGLGTEQLALACASHQGAAIHRQRVEHWLADLGLGDGDLRCGPQVPNDKDERERLRDTGQSPCQIHNNCSGKHAGFLTLNRHLGGDADYVDPGHPVQKAVRAAFEEMTGETSPGYGIDGCSAPNFATSLHGLGRAMARMAKPDGLGRVREEAARALVDAMMRHPELVAGEGRACTRLMRAMGPRAAIKTGAEAVFVAILPERGLGVALKIEDGGTRASETAIAALLVRLGVADPDHPEVRHYLKTPDHNRRGILTGTVHATEALFEGGKPL